MDSQNFSPSSLDCDILDQFIGPNGEEPQILLSVGSKTLVTTDGYPPWVSFTNISFTNLSHLPTCRIYQLILSLEISKIILGIATDINVSLSFSLFWP